MDIKAHWLTGIWNKTKGLIGTKKANPVYFETRWGIHTFGMKYPIDVLILDNNNLVIKTKEVLKPNKIWIWNPKYNKVIELPAGEINQKKIVYRTEITVIPI
jgi:uncharacterized protein